MTGLLSDDGARVAVVGFVLMIVCSSLLGVLMGWKLRGREVYYWKMIAESQRLTLEKAWLRRNRGSSGGKTNGGINGTAG